MSDNSSGGLGAGESAVGPSQPPPPRSDGLRIWPSRARAPSGEVPEAAGLWGVGRRFRNRLVGDTLQRPEPTSGSAGFATTLNSVVDLCVLLISISIATMLSVSERPVEISFPEFVFTTFAAGLVWVIACAVLRHYDLRAFERDAVEDACLVSVMVIGLAIFTASSLLDGLAWSETSLIVFRTVHHGPWFGPRQSPILRRRQIQPARPSEVRSAAPKDRQQRAVAQPHQDREITSALHHEDRAATIEAQRDEPDQDPT